MPSASILKEYHDNHKKTVKNLKERERILRVVMVVNEGNDKIKAPGILPRAFL